MEQDERLLPLPKTEVIQTINTNQDYPPAYSPFYDEETFESKRSIREYLNVVYKRLPLIIALTILTTAVVAVYMYKQPSMYSATTEMIIEPRKPKPQSKDSININFGNDQNYYNTQLKLLQNADLMRDVIVRLGLHRDPNLLNNQNRGVRALFSSIFTSSKSDEENKESSLPILSETAPDAANSEIAVLTPKEKEVAEMYAGILIGSLTIEQVPTTNIVNLSVKSTNPEIAAKVANTTAKIFIEQDIVRETQGAKKDYEDLTKSIEELKAQISGQEAELIGYLRNTGLPLQDKGQELAASRLGELSTQWTAATDKRRELEARYNAAVQANARGEGKNIPDIADSKIYQEQIRINEEKKAKLQDRLRDYEKQISDAETKKAELLVNYTELNPKVATVQAQIDKLKQNKDAAQKEITASLEEGEKRLNREAVSGALVSLKSQLNSAVNREAQARGSYEQEVSQANVDGQNQTRLTTLRREIETNRNLLDSYIQQQKQRELEISSSRPDNIKISAEAQTPTGPYGPNRERNIIIALMVSLAAGIGLAFLMDYLDDSIKSSDDVGRHLGLPTLALIPYQSGLERKKGLLAAKNGNGNGTALASSTAMIALSDKRSAMAEAYRHLRTSLLFSSAGKPPQIILVTSSQPAEGKTTTAINTAITLAQSGADVVIIDCDLRRPRLHSHFDLQNTTGLTNYLSGEKNTRNLMKTFADLPNLKVITSGPIPPNPAELLSSNEMKNLLQYLRGNFQHIVIDSPPAISFTDAAILSTVVDGVVLVAMAGKSSIHLMRRFKHRLANIGARIYGVVLNGLKADSVEYGYYGYGYNYNYYAAAEDDNSTPKMDEWENVLSMNKNNKE